MATYTLKQFILESCKFLHIEAVEQKQSNEYRLLIPPMLQHEFHQNTIDISFEKTNDPDRLYLTFESFLTQKIAALVADRNDGVSSGIREQRLDEMKHKVRAAFVPDCHIDFQAKGTLEFDHLVMWSKITLQGYWIDEYISGMRYSFSKDEVETLADAKLDFLDEIAEQLILDISADSVNRAVDLLAQKAEQEAERFFREKQDEIDRMFEKEVARINEYYQILQLENSVAETSRKRSAVEELDLLDSECTQLIEQQRNKYTITQDSMTVEPVAMLLLRNRIECGDATVQNKYGNFTLPMRADKTVEVSCQVSGNRSGPFTITSDNMVVLPIHTFNCGECSSLREKSKQASCTVCYESFCVDCTSHSEISNDTLCNKHKKQCECCLQTISDKELHFCGACHQYYCKQCTPTDECLYCRSLMPVKGMTPIIQQILSQANLKASKYEFFEKGNRLYLLGKGMVWKSFFVCYDLKEKKIVELQQFGLFNKKKS